MNEQMKEQTNGRKKTQNTLHALSQWIVWSLETKCSNIIATKHVRMFPLLMQRTRSVHSNGSRASLSLGNAQKVAQQQHRRKQMHTRCSCTACWLYSLTLYLIHFFGFGKVRICAILRLLTLWYERIMKKREQNGGLIHHGNDTQNNPVYCFMLSHTLPLFTQTNIHARTHTHTRMHVW